MISDILLGALIAISGTFIGSVATIGVQLIIEHNRNKREKEKLIYELGKTYWQEALIKARESRSPSYVYPLETFILGIKFFYEELSGVKLSEDVLKNFLERYSKVSKIAKSHFDKE